MWKNARDKTRFLFNHAPGHLTLPGTAGSSPVQSLFTDMTLSQFFNTAFKTAVVGGAMLAVARLVYAGFLYMTSDLPAAKGNAKEIIGETVTGLILLLAVALILQIINPQLLNLEILREVKGTTTTTGVQSSTIPSAIGTGQGTVPKQTVSSPAPKPTPPKEIPKTPPPEPPPVRRNLTRSEASGICGQQTATLYSCGYASLATCQADDQMVTNCGNIVPGVGKAQP